MRVFFQFCGRKSFALLLFLILVLVSFALVDSSTAADQPAWGNKPVLAHYLLNSELAGEMKHELTLTDAQIAVLIEIASREAHQVRVLEGESLDIINDNGLNHAQKEEMIIQMAYNLRLSRILDENQALLRDQLGIVEHRRVTKWMEEMWNAERNLSEQESERLGWEPESKSLTQSTYPRSFEVYATRYDAGGRYIIALPDKCLKFANGGAMQCSDGYQYGQNYSVAISYNGKMVVATVGESGPWNIDDNYWSRLSDPQPRRMFADLPLGVPEAQAAYFDGYNGGVDQFGRVVTSPVAIDISYAVAEDLGLPSGNNKVTVSFLWTEGWDSPGNSNDDVQNTPQPGVTPIVAATPRSDGSIIHIVQQGQTLVGIANIYEVPIQELLSLNGLTLDSIILPGDEVIVKTADPTPVETEPVLIVAGTDQPTHTSTPRPTFTPLADPDQTPVQSTPTALDAEQPQADSNIDPLLLIIGIVAIAGIGLLLWGSVANRRR